MSRYQKAVGVFFVTLFGVWGCARGPATQPAANNDKVKTLETKISKLEEELKTALALKEQTRRQFNEAEESQARLQQEIDRLRLATKERDELKIDLRARTNERDQLQTQYDGFRKNIKELLGQAETSLDNRGKPHGGIVSN